ncbi:MAG: uroporphyrinogen decarboxylase [Rhodospirillales bacterium]|nr:uroporphyrinogen decarboxylase [Rhodospirillales bacterium]MSP80613.1 uroporphyrinogen decarboxylase [Rhodospirillales bacterium]
MIKKFIEALKGRRMSPPPWWLMRQAGRYLPEYRELRARAKGFLDFCYRPEMAVEATLQPLRRFGMDAAILFSDILVVPDALGQKLEFREGEGPVLEPLVSSRDIARLEPENLDRHLAPVYAAVRRIADELPAEVALIGFAGAPWTVAVYMVEGRGGGERTKIRDWFRARPADGETLLELLADATVAHLSRQIESGAEAVQLFDSWAGGLDDEEFRRFVIAPTKVIVAKLKAHHPGVPIIGFPREAASRYPEYARATGVDAIGLDGAVVPAWAVREIAGGCALQGNLDNRVLVAGGARLADEARRILDGFRDRPHVFNLGHGVLPETPPAHVAELAQIIRAWKD